MGDAARKIVPASVAANDAPAARHAAPELRPFVVAMAKLLLADLTRRPPVKE